MSERLYKLLKDPLAFKDMCWPGMQFYDRQVEIIKSVESNFITVVPAGNKLGKDFIAGFISLWFFCSRQPARVITSSVDGSQLEGVLWGEIRRFLRSSAIPLPVKENHLHLRHMMPDGSLHPLSEMLGRVVSKGESLLGRHLAHGAGMEPRVLAVIDEASGFDDENFSSVLTWAHRILIIGNPFPCENFFKRYVQAGDVVADEGSPYKHSVKVIQIPADHSPNVRLAMTEEAQGRVATREILIPGCMDIDDYRFRRKTFDPILASAGLDAEFYEGKEVRLYPLDALTRSRDLGQALLSMRKRRARGLGVDAAEGGDSSVWTVVDDYGILHQLSLKTKDTNEIPKITLGLMREYHLRADQVAFDRGGGGKQHADRMRAKGYDVRTIGFGESATDPNKARKTTLIRETVDKRVKAEEGRYVYKNRRVEMYDVLARRMESDKGFGIPPKYTELLRQMKPMPKKYDGEGRQYLPPKDKPNDTYKGDTIKQILGCSPDELDSLVLAVYVMDRKHAKPHAGAV